MNTQSILNDNPQIGILIRDGKPVYYVNWPTYREASDPAQLVGKRALTYRQRLALAVNAVGSTRATLVSPAQELRSLLQDRRVRASVYEDNREPRGRAFYAVDTLGQMAYDDAIEYWGEQL